MATDPTARTYHSLTAAYEHFNARLFEGHLPACLITMQRKNRAYGYFAGGRFGSQTENHTADEIALNPSHFRARTTEQTLSTLVHEMVHLQQAHFGKPSRTGYHNKEWARLMRAVGLIPSDTGAPGGRETGQQVSHYIEAGGAFARACAELVEGAGFVVPYVELWSEQDAKARKAKAASKTAYACPGCGVKAWARPGVDLRCGPCREQLVAEAGEDDEGADGTSPASLQAAA